MTTPVPTPKLLKEYLDELDEETLKDFQWFLAQINIDGSRHIPRSKLEKATRVETVNKLVEVFGEDGAVEWTIDTFSRMNLNDLASKLVQAKEDQSMEQREEEPETSSARGEPREVDPPVPEDLRCSICLSLFTDPVMLQCGHSFCQTCVHKDWEMKIARECSLCKQFIPEGEPPINFSLKSLCENYRGRSQDEPSGGHRNHTETFQTPPENIRETQEALKEVKQLCDSSIERIKIQSFNTENKITDVFKKLHDFLNEEEKTRRAALRKEARLKTHMIYLMHEKIKNTYSLSHTMGETEHFGDDERFISTRVTDVLRVETTLNMLINSKARINVSKHVQNLPLDVWKKMWNDIKQTGYEDDDLSRLSAFDFRSKMKFNDTQQPCPGNPERSTRYQQNLQKSPKRRRVEQDYEDGKGSFLDLDHNTSILTHEGTLSQPPVLHFGDEDEAEQHPSPGNPERSTSFQQNLEKSLKRNLVLSHLEHLLSSSDDEEEIPDVTLMPVRSIKFLDKVKAEQGRAETSSNIFSSSEVEDVKDIQRVEAYSFIDEGALKRAHGAGDETMN